MGECRSGGLFGALALGTNLAGRDIKIWNCAGIVGRGARVQGVAHGMLLLRLLGAEHTRAKACPMTRASHSSIPLMLEPLLNGFDPGRRFLLFCSARLYARYPVLGPVRPSSFVRGNLFTICST
jgi:hypothetical protein